ncbi:MAG TPA: hypothetical protein VLT33_30700 [Labilithrix sp.]|nr:hypothetical protein [Labilithrix sp.]
MLDRLAREHGGTPSSRGVGFGLGPGERVTPFRCEVGPSSFETVEYQGRTWESLRFYARCPTKVPGHGTLGRPRGKGP